MIIKNMIVSNYSSLRVPIFIGAKQSQGEEDRLLLPDQSFRARNDGQNKINPSS